MSLLDRLNEAEAEESHTPEDRRRIMVAFMGLKREVLGGSFTGKELDRLGKRFKDLEAAIKKLR